MSDTPPPPPPPPDAPPPPPPSMGPSAGPYGVAATGPIGKPRSIGLVILLTIVTLGIWTLVWSYQNGDELKRHRGQGLGGIAYLIITFLLAPVTMFLLAGEVEGMYRDAGKEPRITVVWGLWFLLPVIGNIIWYVRIQRALNEHWQSLGATGSPGL